MARTIDFFRDRQMLCDVCGATWVASLDWLERWAESKEACPGCGVNCEEERSAHVTVAPDDPALHGENVAHLDWFHTTTHSDWPSPNFDPAAKLDRDTRLRMGGDGPVAEWAERQRGKALHVGSYEAAIHNMLRRISDQADQGKQFYLYRVRLRPTVTVREGWETDPSDFMGDVALNNVCPPGVDVGRYLNLHEDPGALSLALGRTAIASVTRLEIPLLLREESDWAAMAAREIKRAVAPPPDVESRLARLRRPEPPPVTRARELVRHFAEDLPANLRWQFESATAFDEDQGPGEWGSYVVALADLILRPQDVLRALDSQVERSVQ